MTTSRRIGWLKRSSKRQKPAFGVLALALAGAAAVGCDEGGRFDEDESEAGTGKADGISDPEDFTRRYWQTCKQVLGDAPAVSWNDADIVPITQTLDDGTVVEIDGPLAPGANETRWCDAPEGLVSDPANMGCIPNQRVKRIETTNDQGQRVHWFYIWRFGDSKLDQELEHTHSAGIIAINEETGDTCYADAIPTEQVEGRDGQVHPAVDPGKLPRVTEDSEAVNEFWSPGQTDCVRCHNASPWIRNPWISQVGDAVPELPGRQKWKHRLVMADEVRAWFAQASIPEPERDAHPSTFRGAKLVGKDVATCTGCHDIGAREYCGSFVPAAFGIVPGEDNPYGVEIDPDYYDAYYEMSIRRYVDSLPPDRRSFPERGWHNFMAPVNLKPGDTEIPQARADRVGSALRYIQSCCTNPMDPQDVMPSECEWIDTTTGERIDWNRLPQGGREPPPPVRHGDVEFSWYRSPSGPPNFDPSRGKVAIFIHGWHQTNKADSLYLDFTFGGLLQEGELVDHAAELQRQGYNVAILNWFDAAHTEKVGEAEKNAFDVDFAGDLQLAYRQGMQPVRDAAESRGELLEVRVVAHSLGCEVASQLVYGLLGLLGEDETLVPSGEILWPSRIACIDPYFSRPLSCDDPGENGCVKEAWNKPALFDPAALTFERFSYYHAARFGADPDYALEVYATQDQLFEILGSGNRELLELAAFEELEPWVDGVQPNSLNPLDWIWDWGNRRHTYPLYWYFATWIDGYDPATEGDQTGISAATEPAVLREAIAGGFFFTQTGGAGDLDPTNDRFERRSSP